MSEYAPGCKIRISKNTLYVKRLTENLMGLFDAPGCKSQFEIERIFTGLYWSFCQ